MTHVIRGQRFGNIPAGNYATFFDDGTLRGYGNATAFDDLRTDAISARSGVIAPTLTTGFRGDANLEYRAFVSNQADEIQFPVQFPHAWAEGTGAYPHFHISPTTTGTGTAKFVLSMYPANVNAQFPASPVTYEMTATWATNQQWYHLIASNATALDLTGYTLSHIWMCRLYRDNTVVGNYAADIAGLYFDIHFEIDAFGSREEYVK